MNPHIERMALAPREQVASACMRTLTGLQDFPVDTQAVALTIAFIRLCKHSGIRPAEAMQIAENVHTDGERVHPAFRTVDAYIKGENLSV